MTDREMKIYEYKDSGGRNLCKQHHMLKCSECFYVDILEQKYKRYRRGLRRILELLDSEGWSQFDAIALEDNIHDFVTNLLGDEDHESS